MRIRTSFLSFSSKRTLIQIRNLPPGFYRKIGNKKKQNKSRNFLPLSSIFSGTKQPIKPLEGKKKFKTSFSLKISMSQINTPFGSRENPRTKPKSPTFKSQNPITKTCNKTRTKRSRKHNNIHNKIFPFLALSPIFSATKHPKKFKIYIYRIRNTHMMDRRFRVSRKGKLMGLGRPDLKMFSSTMEKLEGGT